MKCKSYDKDSPDSNSSTDLKIINIMLYTGVIKCKGNFN
jgi:hypothetical protein